MDEKYAFRSKRQFDSAALQSQHKEFFVAV
jgi:hypothetical protein